MNRNHRRFRTRIVGLATSCAVLIGCAGVLAAKPHGDGSANTARLNQEFKLMVGQRVSLKRTNLRIKFLAVENDSRCPSDVTCVWAGNAAVQFQLSAGSGSKTVTLNTANNTTLTGETEYRGLKVKLVSLSPYPRSTRKIGTRDYVATLLVTQE